MNHIQLPDKVSKTMMQANGDAQFKEKRFSENHSRMLSQDQQFFQRQSGRKNQCERNCLNYEEEQRKNNSEYPYDHILLDELDNIDSSRPFNLREFLQTNIWLIITPLLIYIAFLARFLIYTFLLDDKLKMQHDAYGKYFDDKVKEVPYSLILGPFIGVAFARWSALSEAIPTTDVLVQNFIASLKPDAPTNLKFEFSHLVNLLFLTHVSTYSKNLKKRLPNLTAMQELGCISEEEKQHLERKNEKQYFFTVSVWVTKFLQKTSQNGHFLDPYCFNRNNDAVANLKILLENLRRLYFSKKNGLFSKFYLMTKFVVGIFVVFCFLGKDYGTVKTTVSNFAFWINGLFVLDSIIPCLILYAMLGISTMAYDSFGNNKCSINTYDFVLSNYKRAYFICSEFSVPGPSSVL